MCARLTRSLPRPTVRCWTAAGNTRRSTCFTRRGVLQRARTARCFKGLPADGCPEIGYGILEPFWGRGYATEIVRAACLWALTRDDVNAVLAETAPDNAASQRVLAKIGFVPTGEMGEEGPRYRLETPFAE